MTKNEFEELEKIRGLIFDTFEKNYEDLLSCITSLTRFLIKKKNQQNRNVIPVDFIKLHTTKNNTKSSI